MVIYFGLRPIYQFLYGYTKPQHFKNEFTSIFMWRGYKEIPIVLGTIIELTLISLQQSRNFFVWFLLSDFPRKLSTTNRISALFYSVKGYLSHTFHVSVSYHTHTIAPSTQNTGFMNYTPSAPYHNIIHIYLNHTPPLTQTHPPYHLDTVFSKIPPVTPLPL
jgi:hypothetical protein